MDVSPFSGTAETTIWPTICPTIWPTIWRTIWPTILPTIWLTILLCCSSGPFGPPFGSPFGLVAVLDHSAHHLAHYPPHCFGPVYGAGWGGQRFPPKALTIWLCMFLARFQGVSRIVFDHLAPFATESSLGSFLVLYFADKVCRTLCNRHQSRRASSDLHGAKASQTRS